jgi:hypothetical protein
MDKSFVEMLESEAKGQLAEVQAYRAYRGNNGDYAKRAKLAIGVIGAYVRLRATMANERSNELIAMRIGAESATKALPAKDGGDAE